MSTELRLAIAAALSGLTLEARDAFSLPEQLYALDGKKAVTTLEPFCDNPIFYIVVPEMQTSPLSQQARLNELVAFTQGVTIPGHFFMRNVPRTPEQPVILFLNWNEQESHKARKQAGQTLAAGIDSLRKRFRESKFVLLGHGHGGNVINLASNNIAEPVDVVIQLSTPIFPFIENAEKNQYLDYVPNRKKIKRMLSFYSKQAFLLLHPTLHPQYQEVYPEGVHDALTNVLLLINNQHPQPSEMLRPLVGKKIVELCHQIHSSYRVHNHLVAHLSTVKPETDMIVVVKEPTLQNPFKVEKGFADKVTQERMLSMLNEKRFKKCWGRPMAVTLNAGEKSRKQYKGIKELKVAHTTT